MERPMRVLLVAFVIVIIAGAGYVGQHSMQAGSTPAAEAPPTVEVTRGDETFPVRNGAVVIAAITSCTNTSNPSVMIAAGLLAKKAKALPIPVESPANTVRPKANRTVFVS